MGPRVGVRMIVQLRIAYNGTVGEKRNVSTATCATTRPMLPLTSLAPPKGIHCLHDEGLSKTVGQNGGVNAELRDRFVGVVRTSACILILTKSHGTAIKEPTPPAMQAATIFFQMGTGLRVRNVFRISQTPLIG
jgi:hypothetical protein